MNNIQKLGLQLVKDNISKEAWVEFDKRWFTFYIDNCGQRGHYIIPMKMYGNMIPDHYIVKRVLSFTNEVDEGKDGAILGVFNLTECRVLEIKEKSIVFENFTIYLEGNPSTRGMNFKYE